MLNWTPSLLEYSGTPLFRGSEPLKCEHLILKTFCSGTDCICIKSHYIIPPEIGQPLFHKWTSTSAPLVPRLHKLHSNADAHMPLMQGCMPLPLDSTSRHRNSTGTHSTSLWISPSCQHTARESSGRQICSVTCTHCLAHWKYIPEGSEIQRNCQWLDHAN